MSKPSTHQPPKYRRSWLGRLILLALVVLWSVVWIQDLSNKDDLILEFGAAHLGASSQQNVVVVDVGISSKQKFHRPRFRYHATINIPGFTYFRDGEYSHFATPKAKYERDDVQSHLGLLVPDWFLIVLTILAYFAIGEFRRWRFNRWAKRTGAYERPPIGGQILGRFNYSAAVKSSNVQRFDVTPAAIAGVTRIVPGRQQKL